MALRERSGSKVLERFETLRDLGLAANVAEFEALGLTVVPPDLAAPPGLAENLLERILDIAARRRGVAPDLVTGATHSDITSPDGQLLTNMLTEDEVFEQAVLTPVIDAFSRYALGDDYRLFSCRSIIKGPGALPLFLHADQPDNRAEAHLLNATYALTDYTRAGGSLCYVPGSHRSHRQPLPSEDFSYDGTSFRDAYARVDRGERIECGAPRHAVAVEAPAGSLILWHGNTWHGAYQRTSAGLRVNLIVVLSRRFMDPQEHYAFDAPDWSPKERRTLGLLGLDTAEQPH